MRRVILCLVAAVAALAGTVPAHAQEADVQIGELEPEGRHLKFDVLTSSGPELTSDDFRVTVNGIPAEGLLALSGAGVRHPAGAVLTLDTSGSMAFGATEEAKPIAEAKKAARLFLKSVDPTARISLVTFSSDVRRLTDFSDSRGEALRAVGDLRAEGNTALFDAVVEATSLVDERPPEQRNIVLLSDGADTVSDESLGRAVEAARSAGVKVFAVGLKSEDYKGDPIKRLAEATSGRVFLTEDATRLPSLFQDLAKTLVSSYEIDVVNPDPLASLLEVEVEVFGKKKTASATEVFQLPVTEEDSPELPPLANVPLQVILLIVFIGGAIAVFLTSETVRETRMSPVERVVWYNQDGSEELDSNALIQAAVLERAKDLATQLADRAGLLERLEREIDAAGMKWRPGEVIVASIGLGISVGLLGFALWGPVGALLVGIAALAAPMFYIKFNATLRRRAFVSQLSDVLMLIAGALRAGYSLQQALAAVGEDAKPPASDEFRRAMAEVRLGATLDDALRELARRIGVVDLDWTVMAIQIQREVGGDLAEILEVIADTIRERERLRRHIRALTAEGRLSGLVLGILPFFMAGFLLIRQPAYLEPLYTTRTGLVMMGGALFMMIIGFIWMRKIIKIEV
jgi:tight adherence protein B